MWCVRIHFTDLRVCINGSFHPTRRRPSVHDVLVLDYSLVRIGFVNVVRTFQLHIVIWVLLDSTASDWHVCDLAKTSTSTATLGNWSAISWASFIAGLPCWGSLD
jgi:hypothetical protein